MNKFIAILGMLSMSTMAFAGGMSSLAAKSAVKTDVELSSLTPNLSSDLEFEKIATISMVKTDLYFCFKGASGASISGDTLIDNLIMKSCDKKLEEARALNISNEDIEAIAKRALDENQKSDFDKALEEALNH